MRRALLPLISLLLAGPLALSALAAPGGGNPAAPGRVKKAAVQPAAATVPAPRVVVADIDSGINPYHEAYYAGAGPYAGRSGPSSVTPDVLAEFGIGPAQTIELTRTGNFAADFAADRATWDAIEQGRPYWFKGTNIIAVSFDDTVGKTPILADEGDEHGIGTSSAVLDAHPDAVVLFLEGMADPAAEQLAFTHPAVDIVTTSYGMPGSPPLPFHLTESYGGTVLRGKLHFGASDNSPALSPPDSTSGPWWTIAVAGFHEGSSGGREALSGNVVDVVSDFTQPLPYCSACESGEQSVSGTSFATPRSAGTASAVLLQARRKAGHVGGPVVRSGLGSLMVSGNGTELTPWQVRRALEEAAHVPTLAEYDAESALLEDLSSVPVVDPVASAQTGWGLLSPDPRYGVLAKAAEQLATPTSTKGAQTCAVNTAQHELRFAYWNSVAIGSESFGTTEDPYLPC
ncbi:MAG: hypothetical protein JWN57_660 [Frankiales bacterium]|nr:hypothetical protein [Frankiales bacterium]